MTATVVIAGLGLLAGCSERGTDSGGSDTAVSTPTAATSTVASAPSPVSTPTETARVFDVERMNHDVRAVLVEHYQVDGVGDVSCPRNRAVEAGARFACYVEVAEQQRKVTITVQDNDGRYEVGKLQ
ncbi:protein of unknown function (DUF4333) [Prauserella sp. Am3]|nr:protein of unknown function (DUF4333) [Prauserella sp. Am3]